MDWQFLHEGLSPRLAEWNHLMILTVSRYCDITPIKTTDCHTPVETCICDVGVHMWLMTFQHIIASECVIFTPSLSPPVRPVWLPAGWNSCHDKSTNTVSTDLHFYIDAQRGSSQMLYYEELMKYTELNKQLNKYFFKYWDIKIKRQKLWLI